MAVARPIYPTDEQAADRAARLPIAMAGPTGLTYGVSMAVRPVSVMPGFAVGLAGAVGYTVHALGSLPSRWLVNPLLRRWSTRTVLAVNGLAVAATVAICALFNAATPHWLIMAILFLQGLLRSLQPVTLMAPGYADVKPEDPPAASTIASLSQQIAMSLGIAVAVVVFAVEFGRHACPGSALGVAAIAPVFWAAGRRVACVVPVVPAAACGCGRPNRCHSVTGA